MLPTPRTLLVRPRTRLALAATLLTTLTGMIGGVALGAVSASADITPVGCTLGYSDYNRHGGYFQCASSSPYTGLYRVVVACAHNKGALPTQNVPGPWVRKPSRSAVTCSSAFHAVGLRNQLG